MWKVLYISIALCSLTFMSHGRHLSSKENLQFEKQEVLDFGKILADAHQSNENANGVSAPRLLAKNSPPSWMIQPIQQSPHFQRPVSQNSPPSWMIQPTQPPVDRNQWNQPQNQWNGHENQRNFPHSQQFIPNQNERQVSAAPVFENTQNSLVQQNPSDSNAQMDQVQRHGPDNVIQQTQSPTTAPVIRVQPTEPDVPPRIEQINQVPVAENHQNSPVVQQTQLPLNQIQQNEQNTTPSRVSGTDEPSRGPLVPNTEPPSVNNPIVSPELPKIDPVVENVEDKLLLEPTYPPLLHISGSDENLESNQVPQIIIEQIQVESSTPIMEHVTHPSIIQQTEGPELIDAVIHTDQPFPTAPVIRKTNRPERIRNTPSSWDIQQLFTAPVIRKSNFPLNIQNAQNTQFQAPVITKSSTVSSANYPTAPVITRPPPTTARPVRPTQMVPTQPAQNSPTTTAATLRPTIPIFNPGPTVSRTAPTRLTVPTTVRPATTTSRVYIPTFPSPTTTRTTQSTTRTTRPARPTPTSTSSPLAQKPTTVKNTSERQPQIREQPNTQQSLNDIRKMTENMLSTLNNHILQSISKIW